MPSVLPAASVPVSQQTIQGNFQVHQAAQFVLRMLRSPVVKASAVTVALPTLCVVAFPPALAVKIGLAAAAALCAVQSQETKKRFLYEYSLGLTLLWSKLKIRNQQWYHPIREGLILGGIPLSNYGHLEQLKREGVTTVISLVEPFEREASLFGIPVKPEEWEKAGIAYHSFPSVDFHAVSVENLAKTALIIGKRKPKETVYVHCKSGIGRSAAVILAYLMISERLTLNQAIQSVSQIRHITPRWSLPTLQAFEQKLTVPCKEKA
jgi:protein-tyrosine phosphatase